MERMRQSGTVDSTMPRAVLALAQIYVDLDQAPKAIALLDDEKIGVLPMVQRKMRRSTRPSCGNMRTGWR